MEEDQKSEQEQQQKKPLMKIELEEFYLDGGELESELKHRITQKVVRSVMDKISDQVDKMVQEIVKEEFSQTLQDKIKTLVQQAAKDVKIKQRYSKEERTLEEYVVHLLENDNSHSGVNKKIETTLKDIGDSHFEKLKDRFDMLYATQLLHRMKESNLLKEEVAHTLLMNKETPDDQEES